MNSTEHTTPDGTYWLIEDNIDGTFKATSDNGEENSSPKRTKPQFLADLTRKYPAKKGENATPSNHGRLAKLAEVVRPLEVTGLSTGDWERDKNLRWIKGFSDGTEEEVRGYCARVVRPTDDKPDSFAHIDGPNDAFIWFGQPDEGNPWVNKLPDPTNKDNWIPCVPFVDKAKISSHLCGIPVEWVAWDGETGCNVYRRSA